MTEQLTTIGAYNVGKSETGKFVVLLNGSKASFLPFDRYKDCLDKCVKLNANYGGAVTPKFKKLFSTNSRGKTGAAKPRLC